MIDYHTYINSQAWKDKREEFFAAGGKHSKRCYICQKPRASGFHVHHMTYRRLGNEALEDLVLMCETCHDSTHAFHEGLKKSSPSNSNISVYSSTQMARKAFTKNKNTTKIAELSKAKKDRKERKRLKKIAQKAANKRASIAMNASKNHIADADNLSEHFKSL
jgi:hypothetical protein